MTDLHIIQTERNRQLYLLAEATNKSVRKTLRSSIHLFDGLLAQQRGSGLHQGQAATDTDLCPGQIAPGMAAYMPPCRGCGRLTTAKGSATMAAPDFGIKSHRLHCPERVGGVI